MSFQEEASSKESPISVTTQRWMRMFEDEVESIEDFLPFFLCYQRKYPEIPLERREKRGDLDFG